MRADLPPVQGSVTTFTLVSFDRGHRLWQFSRLALSSTLRGSVPGLLFHRLMGVGSGRGFTILPDWQRCALLGIWNDEVAARQFYGDSSFIEFCRSHGANVATAYLRTARAHGSWDGSNPFAVTDDVPQSCGPIAVLTRAKVNLLHVVSFWRHTSRITQQLADADGLIMSIGVGEMPLLRQGTFSIWRSESDMRQFAYNSAEHHCALKRSRREKWHATELFARFHVIDSDRFPSVEA